MFQIFAGLSPCHMLCLPHCMLTVISYLFQNWKELLKFGVHFLPKFSKILGLFGIDFSEEFNLNSKRVFE